MSIGTQPLGELLASIGARQPTPGGGAVASIVATLAAALGEMVVRYSIGKRGLEPHEPALSEALLRLEAIRGEALTAAEVDANAYGALSELMKLDRNDPRRVAAWVGAVDDAIAAPLSVLELAVDVGERAAALDACTNRNLRSDLVMAAILAEAAARSARCNVEINLPLLDDERRRASLRASTDQLVERARRAARALEG